MEIPIGQTSSIGVSWPPAAASQERIRGFYTDGVIAGQTEADRFAGHVYDAVMQMNASPEVTRVSLRAVAELGSLARLNFDGLVDIEAVLPIAGTELGIMYAGANMPARQISASRAALHGQLILGAAQRTSAHPDEHVDIRVVDPNQASELVGAFAPLYAAFNYDQSETEALLGNPSNIIAYAVIDGNVVSTAMAEQGVIPVGGYGDISMVEVTEASTDPRYRQRGLYTRVSSYLLQHLVQTRQEGSNTIDVVYGESNLAMPGVIYAAQRNGRRFSYLDREALGVNNNSFGILPQNFTVNDGTETRAYNDFAVSYLPLGG